MGFLLQLGGRLLLLGTLLLVTGAFASLVAARKATTEVVPARLELASWIGIGLMAVGLLVAFAALFLFVRNRLTRRNRLNYTDEGKKPSLNSRPGQSDRGQNIVE